MGYTLYTLPEPILRTANGINGRETRLEEVPPVYPPTYVQKLRTEGRIELWEDYAGLPADDPTILPMLTRYRESLVAPLWLAANNWQEQYISGLAGGLLTLGVLQGKPKALAIMAWSGALWDEYYRRKAVVMAGGIADDDFTSCGEMPFSVPELREELGL